MREIPKKYRAGYEAEQGPERRPARSSRFAAPLESTPEGGSSRRPGEKTSPAPARARLVEGGQDEVGAFLAEQGVATVTGLDDGAAGVGDGASVAAVGEHGQAPGG